MDGKNTPEPPEPPVTEEDFSSKQQIIAALKESRRQIAILTHVAQTAESIFLEYAQLHRDKGTPEGNRKADANQDHADNIRQALVGIELPFGTSTVVIGKNKTEVNLVDEELMKRVEYSSLIRLLCNGELAQYLACHDYTFKGVPVTTVGVFSIIDGNLTYFPLFIEVPENHVLKPVRGSVSKQPVPDPNPETVH